MPSRRDLLGMAATSAIMTTITSFSPASSSSERLAAPTSTPSSTRYRWVPGIEGQRRADLGNGTYLNPILPGDYPDPTVLKDGDDYYMTHSSFDASPGLLIWHSRDLINWTPLTTALAQPLGTVFASDLIKHENRYYIYIPLLKAKWSTKLEKPVSIWVIHADNMAGPWSEPVDLNISGLIDPGHIVGEDGERYLFLSGINRVKLTPDGLSTVGNVEKVYDGWRYPEDWVTEAYALEGPKLIKRGDWFYMLSAVGGTSGPATGHMVICARSKTVNGPWENCPSNPIVRTHSDSERWWSRGHATAIEGPDGSWHLIYHGYENGLRTLGRQTLMEPITWTSDGWPQALGGDLSKPLPMVKHLYPPTHGMARSDNFSLPAFGTRWAFFGGPNELERAELKANALRLAGQGTSPQDSAPLTQMVGDPNYEISVHIDVIGDATAGLLLFFNDRLFLGMGIDGERMTTYRGGARSHWPEPAPATRSLWLKIVNMHNIVTFYYCEDGKSWAKHGVRSEVSGYNSNTVEYLASLRPALFCAGKGSAEFREFRYKAIS
ncbi:family 43 glycosylhydrolase [Pseudomonas sp. BNK-43-a]|uniref:family 43 glycosylhydrolase n=3 Tax=Pseudomonas TaxID=286 RepID=UPI0039BFBC3A